MTGIEKIAALHPDIVHTILTTRTSKVVDADTVELLLELQAAAEIYDYERNISRAAEKLRLRILAERGKSMPVRTCRTRIYQALDYFAVDNNVSIKVWKSDFANKYEDMARLALAMDDVKSAMRCYAHAERCRVEASEAADKEMAWAPVFILSPDVSLTQMGFEKRSLKAIAKKDNDGYYLRLIDGLPIDEQEKVRLRRDAEVSEAEYEEIEDD